VDGDRLGFTVGVGGLEKQLVQTTIHGHLPLFFEPTTVFCIVVTISVYLPCDPMSVVDFSCSSPQTPSIASILRQCDKTFTALTSEAPCTVRSHLCLGT